MYKLLLCWRYLRTRYIALASIISVMLGVATMIVVNSVMAGFTTEMQNRIHGILADVVVDSRTMEGMRDAEWHMEQIRQVAGDQIEAMTATVVVPAMLSYRYGGQWITRQVQIIGIDAKTQSKVSDFGMYLQHPENRKQMIFELRDGGYDIRDHQAGAEAPVREQMKGAGWPHRLAVANLEAFNRRIAEAQQQPLPLPRENAPAESEDPEASPPEEFVPSDPFAGRRRQDPLADPFSRPQAEPNVFDKAKEQHAGVVLGIGLVSFRTPEGEDRFLTLPGDDVKLTFPTAGTPPKAVSDNFTIVDLYESKMSEYDSSFVFVPIETLQELRGMIDPTTGIGMVSSIQIKLKPGADGAEVRDKLRRAFPAELYSVQTWRDRQGALLAAVQMETTILNVLLFLIIAVAGFGILAIFLMIVVEKTRDIGILKSLGASRGGVMQIFLGYGLSLGVVGSGVGMVLGLLFVEYINQIAALLGWLTGRPVFDPSIYYFYKIPTIVSPFTVGWIVAGAMVIAVLASVLPALRAATLHPVEALRYE